MNEDKDALTELGQQKDDAVPETAEKADAGTRPSAREHAEAETAPEGEKGSAADAGNERPSTGGRGDGGKPDENTKKLVCCLAYLFGILFFLPLIYAGEDKFAKFHANQSLVVLLIVIVGEVLFGVLAGIPGLGVIFGIVIGVFNLAVLVACIYAILGAAQGEERKIPLIGGIRLLK